MTQKNKNHFIIQPQKGQACGLYIDKLIGRLLHEERCNHNHTLQMLSRRTGLSIKDIDEAEIAHGKPHWHTICSLLEHYHKHIEICIINDKNQTHPLS